MKKWVSLILAVMLVMISAVSSAEVKVWSAMKNYKMKQLDGAVFDLKKTLEEKDLALIDLWYIDCPGCQPVLASMQTVYDEYRDRVAFLSVNLLDKPDDIRRFEEARGYTVPCASNGNARSWAAWFPWFLLIDKNGMVLYSYTGAGDPDSLEALLDWALAMTPEQKSEWKSEKTEYDLGSTATDKKRSPEERKRRELYVTGAGLAYNIKGDMSLEVEGKSVSRVVVDAYPEILRRFELAGDFFIVPEGEPFTVIVKTGKGFKPAKARMTAVRFPQPGTLALNLGNYSYVGEDIPFSKAKKGKNSYTFECIGGKTDMSWFFVESGEITDTVKDSIVGLHTFATKEEADRYFTQAAGMMGYDFKWHFE